MTNEITNAILSLWSARRRTKHTPSGWISGNAVCCHHRGEKQDTRGRGGLLITPNDGFQWHCFNCNFKAGWTPGKLLSSNTKLLFKWLGMSEADIGKLGLIAMKVQSNKPVDHKPLNFDLVEKELPKSSKSIDEWVNDPNLQDRQQLAEVINYIITARSLKWDWYPWHWSPTPGFKDRVILPFYYNGKVVGYTGRKITEGKPKYLTDAQPGYVFNMDAQTGNKKYAIVVEGQFDAIAIDGIAVMHNEPNETQCARINTLGREIIVVPDRDPPGAKMLKAALEHNWSVSVPPWEDDIKDVADAVRRYGRIYTLFTILQYRVHGEIKINLLKKKLESIDVQK